MAHSNSQWALELSILGIFIQGFTRTDESKHLSLVRQRYFWPQLLIGFGYRLKNNYSNVWREIIIRFGLAKWNELEMVLTDELCSC